MIIDRKQIKQDVLNRLKKDDDTLYAIAKHSRMKFLTVYAWTKQSHPNHIMLTAEGNQAIIKKGLGLSEEEVITEDVGEAAALIQA